MIPHDVYFSPNETGGLGVDDASPKNETTETSDWHGQSAYLQSDLEAAKAFSKYKTSDDQLRAHRDAMKVLGQPYRLPKDFSKLTPEQQAELNGSINKMRGVPDSPDAYDFEMPEDVPVDEDGMTEFRAACHEEGITVKAGQRILGVQTNLVKRLNAAREKVIQGMTDNNFKTFLNEDCGGDKDVAKTRLELVKRYLQSQFTKDGEIDTPGWEKFATRIYHGDRVIELPILRALHEAAVLKMGSGGAPGGGYERMARTGTKLYSEMHRK